jgi:hypothetical protein
VKRKRATQESDQLRNSRLQTHQDDEPRAELEAAKFSTTAISGDVPFAHNSGYIAITHDRSVNVAFQARIGASRCHPLLSEIRVMLEHL